MLIAPAGVADSDRPVAGRLYGPARARAAWAVTGAEAAIMPAENIRRVRLVACFADWVECDARTFLGALCISIARARKYLLAALFAAMEQKCFRKSSRGNCSRRRITFVPANHWLLITMSRPFAPH